ncbi:diacylglycerol/lipid kinase family protein [Pengzhenrongella frigida]|uniref:Diacylglycerol kinase n=1 Tax=Pengzhenrongella frigida TaxID=1259133 RepID=A0A4Q5N253_9MICO|nr:diacylglycerol kinase family protein [Cellulomonas sp. HLT2-17]RYV51283.1 diacylglycerol kinase [Cellulomonas sp. HLT2-17]
MDARRWSAVGAVVLIGAAVVAAAVTAVQNFPRGIILVALLAGAVLAAYEAVWRRGRSRTLLLGAAGVLLVAAVVATFVWQLWLDLAVVGVLLALGLTLARRAFRASVRLDPAVPPRHAVVVWNPRSGGGKALAAGLAAEAQARGIEPIELRPGDDLERLVRDAVARGADALAAAGGDGTQALVARIAAEHDLPFACIPAGTRNHFALDLGVDRDDVVGALDAFVDGGERRVDLAEVNGRTFVNNVSLGVYASAVQEAGYRDAKLRTLLETASAFGGAGGDGEDPDGAQRELRWIGPGGEPQSRAAVILVSNNPYRLGELLGAGTRPAIDRHTLGIAVMTGPTGRTTDGRARPPWEQWQAEQFVIDCAGKVPIGVDGEALVLSAPLEFTIRPAALRVRLAPQHPGASPSAQLPDGPADGVRRLVSIAVGRQH